MERRLGRGLGSLLSGPTAGERPAELPLDALRPNPYQPRRSFDPAALEELAQSLRRHGLLQPVVVRPAGEGYELISGERRWRAARRAGLERIPVLVRETDDDAMLELALVENVQRQDLNPLEKALGYRDLMTTLELTQE
jgi:ParB family chromosome partitioning protein